MISTSPASPDNQNRTETGGFGSETSAHSEGTHILQQKHTNQQQK